MFQYDMEEFLEFVQGLSSKNFMYDDTAENLSKFYGLKLPASLAGAKISPAKGKAKGKKSFVYSTLRWPDFAWTLRWFAKTKCYLVCINHEDHVHCIHVCVTCLDSWPGPGCYIHGSYD